VSFHAFHHQNADVRRFLRLQRVTVNKLLGYLEPFTLTADARIKLKRFFPATWATHG
jgi:hypothetical protein